MATDAKNTDPLEDEDPLLRRTISVYKLLRYWVKSRDAMNEFGFLPVTSRSEPGPDGDGGGVVTVMLPPWIFEELGGPAAVQKILESGHAPVPHEPIPRTRLPFADLTPEERRAEYDRQVAAGVKDLDALNEVYPLSTPADAPEVAPAIPSSAADVDRALTGGTPIEEEGQLDREQPAITEEEEESLARARKDEVFTTAFPGPCVANCGNQACTRKRFSAKRDTYARIDDACFARIAAKGAA